jgi:hypothetical protein
MARMPRSLALLDAPVCAVVMDTDGTVNALVGLLGLEVWVAASVMACGSCKLLVF